VDDRTAEDGALVARVVGGDRAAFGELVRRYQALVAGAAWRYGMRGADLEDTVSDVFIHIYDVLGRYRPDHPLSTWLYRVAVNAVLDRVRRSRREIVDSVKAERAAEAAAVRNESGVSEAEERAHLVRGAVRELPPHYREPLFLVYLEGMSVADACRVLGLPAGTVKSRLLRGRERLRRSLVERYPEHFGGLDAV
jgi:RNA polymerase sigma-70 factor (ECF subfamily)